MTIVAFNREQRLAQVSGGAVYRLDGGDVSGVGVGAELGLEQVTHRKSFPAELNNGHHVLVLAVTGWELFAEVKP